MTEKSKINFEAPDFSRCFEQKSFENSLLFFLRRLLSKPGLEIRFEMSAEMRQSGSDP